LEPVTEWQRLTEYYRERVDEELIDLARDFEGLTDVAQGVLRDELKRRGLPGPEDLASRPAERTGTPFWRHPATDAEIPVHAEDIGEGQHDYTWKVVLCECNEREDAMDVIETLKGAGIESWYDGPSNSFSTLPFGPRVLVAADDLDAAQKILERPVSQEIRDQNRIAVPDFEVPSCAKCGAPDPLLESVEPSNTWLCENCGTRWNE
jgi:hypothetical protein